MASTTAEEFNFDVRPGTLSKVVLAIVAQARANIALKSDAAASSISIDEVKAGQTKIAGVKGRYTLRQALEHVLADSGFSIREDRGESLHIVRDAGGEDILVTARRRDFVNTSSSLLTRTDTPLRQTPGTIDSVTKEVLQSQNAITIGEALRNIPGVIFSVGSSSSALIGQESSSGVVYSNGLRGSNYGQNPPITDVESIEVLKGPAAILTGTRVAGGVINLVPTRANGNRIANVSMGVGSGKEVLATADIGGALSAVDGLAVRLAGTVQYAEQPPSGGKNAYQRVMNPMIGYQTSGLKVFVGFQFYEKRSPYGAIEAYDPATNAFLSYGDRLSKDGASDVSSKRLNYDLEKNLVDDGGLSLKFRARGQIQWATQAIAYQVSSAYDAFGLGSILTNISQYGDDRQIAQYADLYGKFSTGPVEHQMIVAFDYTNREASAANVSATAITTKPVALTPIPYAGIRDLQQENQYGAIFQDQMAWGPAHLVVGLRKTWYQNDRYLVNSSTKTRATVPTVSKADRLLPNAGVVLDLNKSISVYFNFSNAFSPPSTSLRTVSGDSLLPSIRRQYEVGAKTGLFDDRLAINLSFYKYNSNNAPLADLANPGFYVNSSGTTGKGAEVSVAGSVTKTTKVLAGYSYSTSTLNDDSPVTGTPHDTANLWMIQTVKVADDHSVDLGFGGNYNSGYIVQDGLTGAYYNVKRAYLSANMSIGYTVGKITLNGTINNLFDRRNYFPGSTTAQNSLDVSRSFRVNMRVKL